MNAYDPNNPLDFQKLDIIYSCNDEMAIGALEIVQAIAKEKPENHLPKIIGYDGIPKMLWLIKNGNPHILGTINVKVEKQAEQALATMTAMLEGQRPNILLGLITPESVPNIAVLEM